MSAPLATPEDGKGIAGVTESRKEPNSQQSRGINDFRVFPEEEAKTGILDHNGLSSVAAEGRT